MVLKTFRSTAKTFLFVFRERTVLKPQLTVLPGACTSFQVFIQHYSASFMSIDGSCLSLEGNAQVGNEINNSCQSKSKWPNIRRCKFADGGIIRRNSRESVLFHKVMCSSGTFAAKRTDVEGECDTKSPF